VDLHEEALVVRNVQVNYNNQVKQLPFGAPLAVRKDFQLRFCGLIEIGRHHARNADAGHSPSATATHRVLADLERRAAKYGTAVRAAQSNGNDLDRIRGKRQQRLAGSG
jgi:hypothetical protein